MLSVKVLPEPYFLSGNVAWDSIPMFKISPAKTPLLSSSCGFPTDAAPGEA